MRVSRRLGRFLPSRSGACFLLAFPKIIDISCFEVKRIMMFAGKIPNNPKEEWKDDQF